MDYVPLQTAALTPEYLTKPLLNKLANSKKVLVNTRVNTIREPRPTQKKLMVRGMIEQAERLNRERGRPIRSCPRNCLKQQIQSVESEEEGRRI